MCLASAERASDISPKGHAALSRYTLVKPPALPEVTDKPSAVFTIEFKCVKVDLRCAIVALV